MQTPFRETKRGSFYFLGSLGLKSRFWGLPWKSEGFWSNPGISMRISKPLVLISEKSIETQQICVWKLEIQTFSWQALQKARDSWGLVALKFRGLLQRCLGFWTKSRDPRNKKNHDPPTPTPRKRTPSLVIWTKSICAGYRRIFWRYP